jgi:GTPase SAR1 family protein
MTTNNKIVTEITFCPLEKCIPLFSLTLKNMKREMNGQGFLLRTLFIVVVFGNNLNIPASTVVQINNKARKYTITLPQGWDTIPQSFLEERLKQFNVDLGIYPVSQNDYTNGNYALICFIPTLQSLNAFTFKQIVADIAKSNETSELKNDTMQVYFNQMNTEVRDEKYLYATPIL